MKYITAEIALSRLNREFPCKWEIKENTEDKGWVIVSNPPSLEINISCENNKFHWLLMNMNGNGFISLGEGLYVSSLDKCIRDVKKSLKNWKKRFEWVKA